MGKLGRKISCNYKRDMRCAGLTDGKKLCYLIMDDEERYNEKHEIEFVFCPFFPESEKIVFMVAMKQLGFSIVKQWKDEL